MGNLTLPNKNFCWTSWKKADIISSQTPELKELLRETYPPPAESSDACCHVFVKLINSGEGSIVIIEHLITI
jgi:hypothetical protein